MALLATHVGSLPRSQAVVDCLFARERGEQYDQAAFDACMADAVMEIVRRQKEAGIDIVSDGETSKISYATYVKDRYTGFDGDSPRKPPADLALYPSFLDRLAKQGGTPKYARPQCVGPVRSKGQGELQKDIAALKAAMPPRRVLSRCSCPMRITPRARPISKPSPRRCARNTARSSRPGSISSSIAPISRFRATCCSRI
jgi:5-methyltetrahydropteroyltriglutamate--homocysteine methyltransferase